MTPEAVIIDELERVNRTENGTATFVDNELAKWPTEAVVALKQQGLLTRARPAESTVCPGCEEQCTMPVYSLPTKGGSAFIVCDRRDDINRVAVDSDLISQWRCTVDHVCQFTADQLGIRRSGKRAGDHWPIGLASGKKRNQHLCLEFGNELMLRAGTASIPFADLVRYERDLFTVDKNMVRILVDSSATVDERYTPTRDRREERKSETEERHRRLREAYRALKVRHPEKSDNWCAQHIAKTSDGQGLSKETIRKNMKP